jgi:hypothetical protein
VNWECLTNLRVSGHFFSSDKKIPTQSHVSKLFARGLQPEMQSNVASIGEIADQFATHSQTLSWEQLRGLIHHHNLCVEQLTGESEFFESLRALEQKAFRELGPVIVKPLGAVGGDCCWVIPKDSGTPILEWEKWMAANGYSIRV